MKAANSNPTERGRQESTHPHVEAPTIDGKKVLYTFHLHPGSDELGGGQGSDSEEDIDHIETDSVDSENDAVLFEKTVHNEVEWVGLGNDQMDGSGSDRSSSDNCWDGSEDEDFDSDLGSGDENVDGESNHTCWDIYPIFDNCRTTPNSKKSSAKEGSVPDRPYSVNPTVLVRPSAYSSRRLKKSDTARKAV
ncbi:hypothetical protein OROHE_017182 [Orobanche hederae]